MADYTALARQMFAMMFAAFPDFSIVIHDILQFRDDKAVAH